MDTTTFIMTAGYGDESSARSALEANAELARARNEAGVSVIASTVYAGRLAFAKELAHTRDDLDLFEAACIGDTERAEALLFEDPKAIDRIAPDGFAAIGFAAFFGHLELLSFLLSQGADFETPARNPMRVRPIHSAVAHSDQDKAIALARVLLDAGADPNAQQEGGMTPLHESVYNRNIELASLLLEHGANPHVSNDEGDSPFQLAQSRGEEAMASLLGVDPLE